MAHSNYLANEFEKKKIHIGCSDIILDGYENIDIFQKDSQIKNYNYLKLPYNDNSICEIIINSAIYQLEYSEIKQFFAEIKRIIANDGILTINLIDFDNLIVQYQNSAISLKQLNNLIFSEYRPFKSVINKNYIFTMLEYHNFEILTFEYDDNMIIQDYRSTIKATLNKSNIAEISNRQDFNLEDDNKNENDLFKGINFEIEKEELNKESDFDFDLFNEVVATNKHADTLDLALLNEVVNFDINDDFKIDEQKEIKSNDETLLNEIINFNFESDLPVQTTQSIDEDTNLLDKILNFNFDEELVEKKENNIKQENENNLLEEIINFNIDSQHTTTKNQNNDENRFDLYDELNLEAKAKYYNPSINIVWEGSQFIYNPLATINREISNKIIESGVADLTIIPYEKDDLDFNKSDAYISLLDNDIRRKKDVQPEIAKLPYAWVRNQKPLKSEAPKGAKWIIMHKSEYSSITKEEKLILSQCDEIWTSSFFSRNAIINSGIEFNKVQVVPSGINPDIFTPLGEKFYLNTNKKLKFLFVGPTNNRKGFDILLETYTKLFNQEDDVCLVIKENINTNYSETTNAKLLINNKKLQFNTPEIIYIDDKLSQSEMASLYRACDIIVSPYRSISMGISLLEAMACGLPVIASRGGASDDFLEEAFTSFIETESKIISNYIDGKEMLSNIEILEPSKDDLNDLLLYYYNNPSNIKSMGMLASAYSRTKWNWENSSIKILRRLDYLYGTKMSSTRENNFTPNYDDAIIFAYAEQSYIEKKYDETINLFRDSIKNNIDRRYMLLALHRITAILINKNEIFAAEEILDTIQKLYFNHPDTIYLKIILEANSNNNIEALNLLSSLMDNWKNYKYESDLGHNLDDLLVLNADLLLALDDIEAAHTLYTTALNFNNYNAYACYGAGLCFKYNDFIDDAIKMFEFAIKLKPDFIEAEKQIAELKN